MSEPQPEVRKQSVDLVCKEIRRLSDAKFHGEARLMFHGGAVLDMYETDHVSIRQMVTPSGPA